jgi:hypothetical protein
MVVSSEGEIVSLLLSGVPPCVRSASELTFCQKRTYCILYTIDGITISGSPAIVYDM